MKKMKKYGGTFLIVVIGTAVNLSIFSGVDLVIFSALVGFIGSLFYSNCVLDEKLEELANRRL